VPVVCGAILFDLLCGDCKVRPDKAMGYAACKDAFCSSEIPQGSIAAGTGAVVGKIRGMPYAMKGGIGACCIQNGDLLVGAVVAVNCVGDVYDSRDGRFIAGVLNEDKSVIERTEEYMLHNYRNQKDFFSGNTMIGAVVTNARLTKAEANKLASMSHDGIARAIRPSHCIFDGDTLFALSAGTVEANISTIGILAARAVESAILKGVKSATSLAGIPANRDILHV
jgi:L-aminopeptidase/D-esterase-like protein